MSKSRRFEEFLDDMLELALTDDASEEAAHATVEETDAANGWKGELIEAWSERWRPHAEERLTMAVLEMTARLRDTLDD